MADTPNTADELAAKAKEQAEKPAPRGRPAKPKQEAQQAEQANPQTLSPLRYAMLPVYFTNGIEVYKAEQKDADTDLLVVKNDLGLPLFRLITPRKVSANLIEQLEKE